jgi:hypothetical protein
LKNGLFISRANHKRQYPNAKESDPLENFNTSAKRAVLLDFFGICRVLHSPLDWLGALSLSKRLEARRRNVWRLGFSRWQAYTPDKPNRSHTHSRTLECLDHEND